MAWLETNSYDSIVEKLENVKNGSCKFNEETKKEAEALLEDKSISKEQRDKIQGYLDFYATLKTCVDTEKEATKESVEQNATILIRKLEEISKDNKSFSKLDKKLVDAIAAQLDYLEQNNTEDYANLLQQISITSTKYRNFVKEWYTNKLPHFEKLIVDEKEKLIWFLTESALNLDKKDLDQRLILFSEAKNKTKQKVILDHIIKNEIDQKGYNIQISTGNKFNVINVDGKIIQNANIEKIKKYISASDIESYQIYTQTVEYKLLNQVSIPTKDNESTTPINLVNSSPEAVRKKLSETTIAKLAIPGLLLAYLFGFIWGKDKDWNKTSFMSRFGKVLLWGAALGLTATTINELWGDTWSMIKSVKDKVDEWADGWVDWVSDTYKQIETWAINTINNNPDFKRTYTEIVKIDKQSPSSLWKENIQHLFQTCSIDETFKYVSTSTIEWFVNNSDNIIAKQIWNDIPTKENWDEYSNSELRSFLSLLLSQRDNGDSHGAALLISKEKTENNTNSTNVSENTKIVPESNQTENNTAIDTENPEKKNLNSPAQSPIENNQDSVEEFNNFITVAQIIDGRNYLFSEDGKSEFLDYSQLSPEVSELLFDYEKTQTKANNLLFILWIVDIKDKDILIEKLYKSINSLNPLDIENGIKELKVSINDILDELPATIGNIWNRQDVLNYLVDEGYYDAASREIVNHNFEKIMWEISQEDIENFYNYYTLTPQIEQALKSIPDFEEKIRNKKDDLEWYISKFKTTILSQPEFAWMSESEIIDQTRKSFLEGYSKSLLFEWAVNNQRKYGWELTQNNETDLFAEIEWIWWFDISEKNADFWWEEALIFIGTQIAATAAWLVTVWAWAVAVNALVYWTRWARVANYVAKSGRIVNWAYSLAGAAASWAAFNVGYTWLNSVLEWKNLYTTEWFVNSAIGWVAFKAAWKVFESLKPALKISGKFVLKHPIIATLWTAWLWTVWYNTMPESIQLEPGEWTQEEILEATTLIITLVLAKKAWNVINNYRITKTQNWIKVDAMRKWEQFAKQYRWEKFHAHYNGTKEEVRQNILNRYSNMKNVQPKI